MKSKFDLYQLITPNIDDYAQYGMASVYGYAQKRGYSYSVQRSQLVEDMHVNWTKIEMIRQALVSSASEWIVLFDADLILMNSEISLDFFIKKVPSNIHILMPGDTHFFKWRKPNAGFIMVRRSQQGRKIVDEWMKASRGEGRHLADKHPRNQGVYWNYVMPKFYNNQQLISRRYCAKYHWFYRFIGHGKFAFHITQTDDQNRSENMKKLVSQKVPITIIEWATAKLRSHRSGLLKLL